MLFPIAILAVNNIYSHVPVREQQQLLGTENYNNKQQNKQQLSKPLLHKGYSHHSKHNNNFTNQQRPPILFLVV